MSRFRARIPGLIQPAARYPADPRAVFVLALSVFSGLTALALDAAPASLEALLPSWAIIAWGLLLTSGSAITLFGMSRQTLNGVILEQIGSVAVAATTVFYAGVAIKVVGVSAFQPMGIILAWGLSCLLRWAQLQALVTKEYRKKVRSDAVEAVKERGRERRRNAGGQP